MTSMKMRFGALAVAGAALFGAFGTVATVSVAQAAPITAPLRTQAPTTGELRAKLAVAFNTNAARATRAAELESGEAGLPAFDRAAVLISLAPADWHWDVVGPVNYTDNVITAVLYTATSGYEPWTFSATWKKIDGTWKFSRESTCEIASFVGASC